MSHEDNIIKQILSLYPDVWKDKKRFRAILNDLLPEDKLRRNLISISIDESIPNDIDKEYEISEIEKSRLSKILISACGCGENIATEIVELWIDALIRDYDYDRLCDIWLEDMDFPEGVQWSFREHGIYTVGDLYNKTRKELYCKYNNKPYIQAVCNLIEEFNIPICEGIPIDVSSVNIGLDVSVRNLGFSEKTTDLLEGLGIKGFDQIRNMTFDESILIEQFDSDFCEVKEFVNKYGMQFKDSCNESLPYLSFLIDGYKSQEDNPSYAIQCLKKAIELDYECRPQDLLMIGVTCIEGLMGVPQDIEGGIDILDQLYLDYDLYDEYDDNIELFSAYYTFGFGYFLACKSDASYSKKYVDRIVDLWSEAIFTAYILDEDGQITDEVVDDLEMIGKQLAFGEGDVPGLKDINLAIVALGIAMKNDEDDDIVKITVYLLDQKNSTEEN